MNELMQVITLAQDAINVGWNFEIENDLLKAIDANFDNEAVTFKNETELLEWLEDQFDKEM